MKYKPHRQQQRCTAPKNIKTFVKQFVFLNLVIFVTFKRSFEVYVRFGSIVKYFS